MQDRFRFRVYLNYNKMLYNISSFCYLNELDKCVFHFDNGTQKTLKTKDFTLMQCTGLKDKNGTLIYEGDIISDKFNKIRVCLWEYDGFKYPALKTSRYFHKPISNQLKERKTDLRKKLTFQDNVYKCDKKEFIVIGNIYENADLLESEV